MFRRERSSFCYFIFRSRILIWKHKYQQFYWSPFSTVLSQHCDQAHRLVLICSLEKVTDPPNISTCHPLNCSHPFRSYDPFDISCFPMDWPRSRPLDKPHIHTWQASSNRLISVKSNSNWSPHLFFEYVSMNYQHLLFIGQFLRFHKRFMFVLGNCSRDSVCQRHWKGSCQVLASRWVG